MKKWKDILGYEGAYRVSNLGNVLSLKYAIPRILKYNYDKQGYCLVHLCKNGIRKVKKVHRLVAEAFIPNKENKIYVNHKNGIKDCNSVKNLEWVTPTENNLHSFKNGFSTPNLTMLGRRGKQNPCSKKILQIDMNNNVVNTYYGANEAERHTKIRATNITSCCKKKVKTAGGYIWEYAS